MRFKVQVLSLVCLLLIGCQTAVKMAGEEHRVTIEKWQELAKYAESDLVNYDVAITAQLSLATQNGRDSYKLSNILFSEKENSFNINLLAPVFENKYICTPVCDQLLEYVPESPDKGSTLLNQYFTKHEFELFEFYGELFKLNEKVAVLVAIQPNLVGAFLRRVIDEQNSVDSLQEFSAYLSQSLSEDDFKQFVANPVARTARFKSYDWYLKHFNLNNNQEADHWVRDKGKQKWAPESDLWVATSTNESAKWSKGAGEAAQWSEGEGEGGGEGGGEVAQIYKANVRFGDSTLTAVEAWQLAKNIDIKLHDKVCSYDKNNFGEVTKVDGKSVTVNLLGQAKIAEDGVISDPDNGFLFSGSGEISFFPLSGSKVFSQRDVAVCYAQ